MGEINRLSSVHDRYLTFLYSLFEITVLGPSVVQARAYKTFSYSHVDEIKALGPLSSKTGTSHHCGLLTFERG